MTLFALARRRCATGVAASGSLLSNGAQPLTCVGLIAYTGSDDVPPAPEDPVTDNTTVNKEARVDMPMDLDWFAAPSEAGDRLGLADPGP